MAVFPPGPQLPEFMSDIECHAEYMSNRVSEYMPDRVSESLPAKMSEIMSDRVSEYVR